MKTVQATKTGNAKIINEEAISIGKNVSFGYNCVVDGGQGNITFEDNVIIGHNCVIQSPKGSIRFKENTAIGNNSSIKTDGGIIEILNNSSIGDSCILNATGGEIQIGQDTKVGDCSRFYSENGKIIVGKEVRIDPDNEIRGKGSVFLGDNCHLWSGSYISAFQNPFYLDHRVTIGQKCVIGGRGKLSIGKLTMIGGQTYIVTETHGYENPFISFRDQDFEAKGIAIGEDVWIAAACRIIDGVNIGKRALIGIGTIITRNVPEYMLALGTNQHHIKFIKDRREDFIYKLEKQLLAKNGDNTAPKTSGSENLERTTKEMEDYLINIRNYSSEQVESIKRYFAESFE